MSRFADAKVADFGQAASLDGASLTTSTRAGTASLVGTYAYMSPEAWRNEYQPKSDVYSFAMVAWEALTQAITFGGTALACIALAIKLAPRWLNSDD